MKSLLWWAITCICISWDIKSVHITVKGTFYSSHTSTVGDYMMPVTFNWTNMSPDQIDAWYPRKIEKCLLFNHRHENDIKRLNGLCGGKGRRMSNTCAPGMGSRGACPGHPSRRKFFFKALAGYDDPSSRPVSEFLRNLYEQKKTLIFVGDSLLLQLVQFFICEAKREKLHVEENHVDTNCYWRFTISIARNKFHVANSPAVTLHYFRIGSLHSSSSCPTSKIGNYNLRNISYTLGTWEHVKNIIKVLTEESAGGAFLVGNIGLWYQRSQKLLYRSDLRNSFLPFMNDFTSNGNKKSNAVVVESVLQHWGTPNGEYHNINRKELNISLLCNSVENYSLSESGDWRNYILRQELDSSNSSFVTLIPMAEAMVGGESMHMSAADCTHVCYFPTLFQYLWHAFKTVAREDCNGAACSKEKF